MWITGVRARGKEHSLYPTFSFVVKRDWLEDIVRGKGTANNDGSASMP